MASIFFSFVFLPLAGKCFDVLMSLLPSFLCLIRCWVVTVLCCQVFLIWILVMEPKCLALLAISHIKSVASASLAHFTVQVLDFIERDITDMSTTCTEEMTNGKTSVRRCRRGKWLLSRIILPTLIFRKCVVPEEQKGTSCSKMISVYSLVFWHLPR